MTSEKGEGVCALEFATHSISLFFGEMSQLETGKGMPKLSSVPPHFLKLANSTNLYENSKSRLNIVYSIDLFLLVVAKRIRLDLQTTTEFYTDNMDKYICT